MWLDVDLPNNLSEKNVVKMISYINPETGYLPISPGTTEGFTGHTLGLLLTGLVKLNNPLRNDILTRLRSLTDCYGTFSEFYGPGGVSNTHNMFLLSSGINIAAMLDYYND